MILGCYGFIYDDGTTFFQPSFFFFQIGSNISVPVIAALRLSLFSPKGKTKSSLSLLRHELGCKQAIYFSFMEGVNAMEHHSSKPGVAG